MSKRNKYANKWMPRMRWARYSGVFVRKAHCTMEKPTGKPTQEMARATGMEMRLNDCDYRDHTTRGASVSRRPFFFRGWLGSHPVLSPEQQAQKSFRAFITLHGERRKMNRWWEKHVTGAIWETIQKQRERTTVMGRKKDESHKVYTYRSLLLTESKR